LPKLFRVNVCVRDTERSIRWCQVLGFTEGRDFTLDDPGVGAAPNSPWANVTRRSTTSASAASPSLLTISTGPRGSADKEGRMCGAAPEGQATDGAPIGAVCFRDPDGAILELTSGV